MLQQVLAIIGIFLSILLICYNYKKNHGIIFIGLFFLLLSAYNFCHYVIIYSKSTTLIGIVFIHLAFIGYAIGPMIYFYIKSSLSDSYSFRKINVLHFLPAILFLIASGRYFFISWNDKTEIASEIIKNKLNLWHISNQYVGWFFPGYVNFIGRPLLVVFYVSLSFYILVKPSKQIKKNIVNKPSKLNYQFLKILLLFVLVLSLAQTFMVIISIYNRDMSNYYSFNVLQIASGIALIGIMIIPFLYPSVLYGLTRFDISPAILESINETNKSKNNENLKDNNHPVFDADYLAYIENTCEECMKNDKPYLQKECNINYFAKIIRIPTHHLSYYFREVRKQSFTDYRNEWRVKHAKALFDEKKLKNYSIEAIGLLSGFSSKNAFFVSYKKFEGITPGNYAALDSKDD